MMKKTVISILSSIIGFTIILGCDKDDDNQTSDNDELTVDLTNLAQLSSDETYEGWIIVDGSPMSTGTFSVDAGGDLSQTTFAVDQDNLENASAFVLTIEPIPDTDEAPSAIKLIGGGFSGNSASVSVDHMAALGSDFASAMGVYILATPTTNDTTDELSGIWFLDNSSGMPSQGLTLPDLPSGWVYEGWAVINGTPVTSGRFTAEDMADGEAPFSGSDASGPPFPGEDYVTSAPSGLNFPTDLSGGKAVISIEPEPDNSPMPFQLKPLVGDIPSSATDHAVYQMNNTAAGTFPEGTVTR